MKKRLSIAFLILPVALALATIAAYGEVKQQVIGPFGTLNNTDNSYTIPSDRSPDLLNVDLSPGGKSVKKRSGYGIAFTLSNSTSPVKYVYNFFNSAGSSVDLYFNDTNMEASISGASPSVIFSTGSNGATYQCVDTAGEAYCANDARTSIIKTDGATDTTITTVRSTGTLLAITPERLVHAGFSEDPSRVDFSNSNDFSTWTLGGEDDDPISFTIVSPGAYLTHITYAHGRVYWFKTSSFGYILEGPTHNDWVVRTLNSNVGTLFNTSVFRDDILYFQGDDGHFYGWDGSSLQKLSRDIQGSIDVTQGRISNSWVQTTQSDFGAGVSTPTVYMDTITTNGSIALTFPDNFDSFRDGSSDTKPVWKQATPNTGCSTGTVSASGGLLKFTDPNSGSGDRVIIYTQEKLKNFQQGTTYQFVINDTHTTGTGGKFLIYFSTSMTSTSCPSLSDTDSAVAWISFDGVAGEKVRANSFSSIRGGQWVFSGTDYDLPATVSIYLSTSFASLNINSINDSTATYGGGYGDVNVFIHYSNNSPGGIGTLDSFSVVPQTGTFYSQVNSAPDLTSWNSFETTKIENGGQISFEIRADTNSFTVESSTPSWTSINSGEIPTISTGTYMQVRSKFSITYATQNPSIQDFTINWFEGSASDKTHAIYHEDALWWAVASGAGATTNNKILKLDLINQGWLLYNIPMNGMLIRSQNLYFGDPTAGRIFGFGTDDSDNGSAIEAYWQSRDFFGDDPFVDKNFNRLSFVTKGNSGSNMDVTYQINGSTATEFSVPLYNSSSDAFVKRNMFFPSGTSGSTINFKFGNNAADEPFELFGGVLEYEDEPWFPEP